jgi:ribosomal RNA methyltransferase Nop2
MPPQGTKRKATPSPPVKRTTRAAASTIKKKNPSPRAAPSPAAAAAAAKSPTASAPGSAKREKAGGSAKKAGGFTDENNSWLKPTPTKKKRRAEPEPEPEPDSDEDDDDDEESEEEDLSEDEALDAEMDQDSEGDSEEGDSEGDESDDEDLLEGVMDKAPKKGTELFSEDESEPESEEDEFAGLDDDEEEGGGDGDEPDSGDESESESEEEELLPIEKKARKEDARRVKEAADARAEQIQTNIQEEDIYELESEDEDPEAPPNLQNVQARIQEVVRVLADFKKRREAGRSRAEYVQRLVADLATYYGYNTFLVQYFLDTFSVAETMELLEANETQRPVTLRTNSLKCRRRELAAALINRGEGGAELHVGVRGMCLKLKETHSPTALRRPAPLSGGGDLT